MNKWFSWNVFDGDISKLERIIQIAVEELEKQKDNNRIERFYFIRQYTQDKHVTFGIKSSEERSSEVFEEVKLPLQQALNRDFTEREGLSENKEKPSQIQELKAIATECALLSKDGISLIASLACFSHFLLNASNDIDKRWLDNEVKKLIKLKDDKEDIFNKIKTIYSPEMKNFIEVAIKIIINADGLKRERDKTN
jgi:hypothetical protein